LRGKSLSVEDIILSRDRRGVSKLRQYMPENYCDQAARLVLDSPNTAMIATGFYISSASAIETDGPPGAIAIGKALQAIGYEVMYVTDCYAAPVMNSVLGEGFEVIEFPILSDKASREFAQKVLSEVDPSVLISIERCGMTREGLYRNMRDIDMSEHTARLDYLFLDHPKTIGIGDGGNEIGMGNLSSVIPTIDSLVKFPCVTKVNKLVISSVSNWGGYGLAAALSKRVGKDVLISEEQEEALVRHIVDEGAVDGVSGVNEYKIDGFTMRESGEVITELHSFLDK